MNKRVTLILCVLGLLVIGLVFLVPRSTFLMTFIAEIAPKAIPASTYAQNLDSNDPDLVRESLAHLADRRDPVAVTRAVQLLQSSDDYIWLNAAYYTGVCGRREAVPYLIKALRHTAWRADNQTSECLHSLTGQDFGTNFARWQEWWLAQHPDSTIDWTSHLGFSPRITGNEGGQQHGPTTGN